MKRPLTPSFDDILATTRERVTGLRRSAAALERRAAVAPPVRRLPEPAAAVGVIAEVKRRSPSSGDIRSDLDPVAHAAAYVAGGAVAVSVLTDEPHFGGSLQDLERVAAAVPVPVLRKDFLLDELQLIEARAAGASAVLLIVRAVSSHQLHALARAADGWGLQTLIEVHAVDELDIALAAGPDAIGVNARDLATFAVDLAKAEAVMRRVPPTVALVAESGIATAADVQRVAAAGADYVLVGTSVARARDPEAAVRALTGVARSGRL